MWTTEATIISQQNTRELPTTRTPPVIQQAIRSKHALHHITLVRYREYAPDPRVRSLGVVSPFDELQAVDRGHGICADGTTL